MNLIALTNDVKHVCMRYRIDPVRSAFASQGHWFGSIALPKTPWGRLALYRDLDQASVVIVQRRLLSTCELPWLRKCTKHLIYDFDDAIFQRDSTYKHAHSPRRLARFKAMVQTVDQVFAGNEYLAQRASEYTSSQKIVVIPTSIDPTPYQTAEHIRRGSGVRLVWIGSSSTLQSLEDQPALWKAISEAIPGIELHLICDRTPRLPGIKVIPVPWSAQIETSYLAQCDIGLAWMPNDTWSLGKCALKILQYQSAGLPVIANPVGVHQQLVIPGKTGMLASSPGEWIHALQQLIIDNRLRLNLGQQGRSLVEKEYSHQKLLHRWQTALQHNRNRLDKTDSSHTSPRTAA